VLVASCLGAVILTAVPEARAEYAVGMEPGRIALRHAAWDAADRCTPLFPRELGDSVELTITLGRRGRVLSIAAEPDVPAFRRCVLRALRRHLVPATGEDRRAPRWVVGRRAPTGSTPASARSPRSASIRSSSRSLQVNLVRSHSTGVGVPYDERPPGR
jgi:hypothetical protein